MDGNGNIHQRQTTMVLEQVTPYLKKLMATWGVPVSDKVTYDNANDMINITDGDNISSDTVDCLYITGLSEITTLGGRTITCGATRPTTAKAGSLHLDTTGVLYLTTADDTWATISHT